ncbi:MAG: BTAD domain-containing putative transcriptional regulator [Acidimicrobiales bacterium]
MLDVRLLGPLEVWSDGGRLRLASRNQRLVLTALVFEAGLVVSADRLVELLWATTLPTDPAAALRTQVSRLRRSLGAQGALIETESTGYRLRVAEDSIDVSRFRTLVAVADSSDADRLTALEGALALWRGRPIDEFVDVEEFRPWLAELDELHLLARWRRGDALVALGRATEGATELERLIEEHPEHEGVRASLMRALYTSGRHADALRKYALWRHRLAEERGLEPGPLLRQLEQDILFHTLEPARPVGLVLPRSLAANALVGRQDDLERCAALLADGRVVTLCGTGGVGKTRLALELGRYVASRYEDGVVVVDLAACVSPHVVLPTIASAVGAEERSGQPLESSLLAALALRRLLLVLDGCEHHLEVVGGFIDRLITHADDVDIVATSRERLSIASERVWDVEPLSTADVRSAAVLLLIDRVQAADPTVVLTDDDLLLSLEICRRLDGLPLAIELAAVRVRSFPLPSLLDRLADRYALLTGGPRHHPRHRSLRAMVDWSYDVLEARARRMFEHLAVFAGDFDVEAALAVAGTNDPRDLTTLLDLVDQSLVARRRTPNTTAFVLLDTLRTYALDHLETRGELADARRRHAAFAIDLAVEMNNAMSSAREDLVARRLVAHLDDVRAAHAWLLESDPAAALRLTCCLRGFALTRGATELFRWAESSVAAAASLDTTSDLAAGWAIVAAGAWQRGDLRAAESAERAAALVVCDSPLDRRFAIETTAELALLGGETSAAVSLYAEAAEFALEAGDLFQAVWNLGSGVLASYYQDKTRPPDQESRQRLRALADQSDAPSALAFAAFVDGEVLAAVDPAAAERSLREAMSRADEVGSTFLGGLARVALAALLGRGRDPVHALEHYAGVIRHWHADGVWTPQWVTLRSLIALLADLQQYEAASLLLGAQQSSPLGAPAYGADASMLRATEHVLRTALGDEAFEQLTAAGAKLDGGAVIDVALEAIEVIR